MTIRVLMVVEDDPDLRLLVRVMFANAPDFEVDGEAADAATAIDLARINKPDLVIHDHKLNGTMTGLEAAPQIKADVPSCSIILFSASEEMREAAMDSPAIDAFLIKTDIAKLVPLARQLVAAA